MSRRSSTLVLSGFLALAACGGGGGGGGGGTPPRTFSITGTVGGLVGSAVLQNNGGASITVSTNGPFNIATGVASGTAYGVAVTTHPELQTCTVTNGAGTVTANVSNISVTCADLAHPALTLSVQQIKAFRFTWTTTPGISRYRLLEDPSGTEGFTQLGTDLDSDVGTTFDHMVPLHKRLDARYIIQACGPARCIDSATVSVSGTLSAAIGYVKKSSTTIADQLGQDMSLSGDGNTLAITASGEDNLANRVGVVYVFRRSGLGWAQEARIVPSRPAQVFGGSLSLSVDGAVLAVGAPVDDNGSPVLSSSGAVYVFNRNIPSGAWTQRAILTALAADSGDRFGTAVSLSADGTALLVGAPGESSNATGVNGNPVDNSATAAGAAYVYEINASGNWVFRAYLKAGNTGANDAFGRAVSMAGDGNTLVVSATDEDSSGSGSGEDNLNSGAVYVFTRTATSWVQSSYLKPSNTGRSDAFGSALVLSGDGNTLAVSAPWEDGGIGGINEDGSDDSARDSGAVYVFARSGTGWIPEAYLKASSPSADDRFGDTLALSSDGATLLTGAPFEDGAGVGLNDEENNLVADAGAAYVFVRNSGAWSQQAYLKAWNTGADDGFGDSVALSGNGATAAVGAPYEDSSRVGAIRAVPDNDDNAALQAGAVYLY
jgi:hypothetical protein